MGTGISIIGGSGSDTVNFAFSVTGANTTRYAENFAATVNGLLADGGSVTKLSPDGTGGGGIFDLLGTTVQGGQSNFSVSGGAYVIDTIGGTVSIDATAGNDTVLATADRSNLTFHETGGNDNVVFVNGNNIFLGDTAAGGGVGDTIVAGAGFDSIFTGAGSATVNSGTGNALIVLQDTAVGSTINDIAWIDNGHAAILANGANDAIIATTAGQLITGGTNANANLTVVLQPNSDSTANGDNTIHAGAGNTMLFAENSNNTIDGGSGALFFVGGQGVSATINGGGGQTLIFAAAGDTITFDNLSGISSGLTELVAGAGNETLDGAAARSSIALFGSADSAANNVLIGGTGNDTIQAGLGHESLTGGAGSNLFVFNAAVDAGANIVLTDFAGAGGQNVAAFTGYDHAALQTALQNGHEDSNGNYVVTLSDNTTITFVGATNAADLTGHIVKF